MLCAGVEKALALLFESEIEYQQQVEISKRDLIRRFDWSPHAAFNSIDTRKDGFFAFNHLLQFCRNYGYNITESEVIAIIRRLDTDADQRINFEEFSFFMDA